MDKQLQNKTVTFLTKFMTHDRRETFLHLAFSATDLFNQIRGWDDDPQGFTIALIGTLDRYGEIKEGEPALVTLLKTIQSQVGLDRQREIDDLITEIVKAYYKRPKPPLIVSPVSVKKEVIEEVKVTPTVSEIVSGDQLGPYIVSQEMWDDTYARMFWAKHETSREDYLIQVLTDTWQDDETIVSKLDEAVRRLEVMGTNSDLLLPQAHELAMWRRQQKEFRALHFLRYQPPAQSMATDLTRLPSELFASDHTNSFKTLIGFGAKISLALRKLHNQNIPHGNLDQQNLIIFHKEEDQLPLIKDAWVKQVSSQRTSEAHYAPPEDASSAEDPHGLKEDCWGLGVILFELATNSKRDESLISIRAKLGVVGSSVPEALERVTRECLIPSASLRPGISLVARRLLLAMYVGGLYVSDLEQELHEYIQAGQRLFAIAVENIQDLQELLESLASHNRGSIGYHLFEAVEGVGLWDVSLNKMEQEWITSEKLHDVWRIDAAQQNLPEPRVPTYDEVAAFNGPLLLQMAAEIQLAANTIPILFIRGNGWWQSDLAQRQTFISRLLKLCQQKEYNLVVMIGDDYITIETELARSFLFLKFPPPTPSQLFEHILSTPAEERLNVLEISVETAVYIARQLYPSSSREVTYALRLCALQFGVIDERVVEIRDEERARAFQRLGTVTYIPISKLPQPKWMGLSSVLEATMQEWITKMVAGGPVLRRLLLIGQSGYGKNLLALTLARQIRLPVVRIEADRCLRGGLGESEETLRLALRAVNSLNGAVVLLDNVDRFWHEAAGQVVAATLSRMATILLRWLDDLPEDTVAILTSTALNVLPAQWQRRVELTLHLDQPPLDKTDAESLDYRRRVFTALFHKHRLNELAKSEEFMDELAWGTHPAQDKRAIPSPIARRLTDHPLGGHTIRLHTGADIEHWISETILLHSNETEAGQPGAVDFWREAIKPI